MNQYCAAQSLLDEIEDAVESGDISAAAERIAGLRPLLVSERVNEVIALRKRIEALKVRVVKTREIHKQNLRQVMGSQQAINSYHQIESHS